MSRPRGRTTLKQREARRLFKLLAVIAALTVVPAAAARADAVSRSSGSERNFVALLRPEHEVRQVHANLLVGARSVRASTRYERRVDPRHSNYLVGRSPRSRRLADTLAVRILTRHRIYVYSHT